ncbi:hypothetical protein [Cellulomonas sp. PhB150]|uniref:putative acetyltransferase n=1 Tax=Cellulomonas sp. PhB150 TaxID=2485188 RepID=UPI000FBF840A|nr:hypothetical protein [Cellulomonas sp. PhB150]ROS23078.1 hypothetical protein EDF34_3254 [Cellulomonas sp. PhB150]
MPARHVMPATWRDLPVGSRVVVRRRRDDDPAPDEPPFTDVLGELLAVDDSGVLIRTRRGEVRVPAADIVLAKPVPPAPPRRGTR